MRFRCSTRSHVCVCVCTHTYSFTGWRVVLQHDICYEVIPIEALRYIIFSTRSSSWTRRITIILFLVVPWKSGANLTSATCCRVSDFHYNRGIVVKKILWQLSWKNKTQTLWNYRRKTSIMLSKLDIHFKILKKKNNREYVFFIVFCSITLTTLRWLMTKSFFKTDIILKYIFNLMV